MRNDSHLYKSKSYKPFDSLESAGKAFDEYMAKYGWNNDSVTAYQTHLMNELERLERAYHRNNLLNEKHYDIY
jgi:hypothetical protein